MPWLRHFALFLVFVAALFRPAAAGAFVSAPDAGLQTRVGAFELVASTLVGPASAATSGLHEGIGAAYDENASGYRFAAGGAVHTVHQGFRSFSAFKRAMGPAGPGQAWHHIVEQTPGNVARFGAEAIHNTGNLVTLAHGAGSIHARISGCRQPRSAEAKEEPAVTVCRFGATLSIRSSATTASR